MFSCSLHFLSTSVRLSRSQFPAASTLKSAKLSTESRLFQSKIRGVGLDVLLNPVSSRPHGDQVRDQLNGLSLSSAMCSNSRGISGSFLGLPLHQFDALTPLQSGTLIRHQVGGHSFFSTSAPSASSQQQTPGAEESASSSSIPALTEWIQHLDHEDYNWLKNPAEKIEVATFMKLPYLGPFALPKGIDDADFQLSSGNPSLPFFVCQSRLNLLHDLHAHVKRLESRPFSTLRMVPAGPQGVGKSMYCYLIACFAAVHRFPLIYIPLASEWVSLQDKPKMSLFVINQFAILNRHWYLPLNLPFYQKLEQVLSYESSELTSAQKEQIVTLQEQLLAKLKTGFDGCPKAARFIIIDEHNELFREEVAGQAPKSTFQSYFRPFCDMTLGGCSVLCGSAHSKFFGTMPGGTTDAIKDLYPLTEEEAVNYWMSPNSPVYMKDMTLHQAKQIFAEFGGLPRIYQKLVQKYHEDLQKNVSLKETIENSLDPKNYVTLRPLAEMEDRFLRFVPTVPKSKFLTYSEGILFSNQFKLPGRANPFMDPGLCYKQPDQPVRLVNKFAYELLKSEYLFSVERKALSSILDGRKRGFELERQVWLGLLEHGTLEYKSLFSAETIRAGSLSMSSRYSYQLFSENSFKNISLPSLHQGVHLLRPLSPNFPYIDFIIVDFEKPHVYLIQCTVEQPKVHCGEKGDWKAFFHLKDSNPEVNSNSEVNSKSQVKSEPKVNWKNLSTKLGISPKTKVDYIYVTTQESINLEEVPPDLPENVTIGVMHSSFLHLLKILVSMKENRKNKIK